MVGCHTTVPFRGGTVYLDILGLIVLLYEQGELETWLPYSIKTSKDQL